MKVVLKVVRMESANDISNIRQAIAETEGVIACHISKETGGVTVVFDNFFVGIDIIIENIENAGYTVLN